MVSFATEFPVPQRHSSTDFTQAIRTWLLGSPHTGLREADLQGIGGQPEWAVQRANERLEFLSVSSSNQELSAARYTRNDNQLKWVTTIGFSKTSNGSWVSVRVSCESSHPLLQLPPAKKPIVVRTLMQALGGASDGTLLVSHEPHRLADADIDVAGRLISGKAACRLPIVYVSAGFHGTHSVAPEHLALDLAGMAHVVVEPNRQFSLRLKLEVNSENVYGGTVGIYWPDGAGRRSFFLGHQFESPADLHQALVEEIRSALCNRRPLDSCTWAAVQGHVSRNTFEALKSAGSQEVSKYVNEFDKELDAKNKTLANAEREIERLRAEVRKYESRTAMGSGIAMQTGEEQDLYAGEINDIVLAAIRDATSRVRKDSRREHVLKAITEANKEIGGASRKREALKEILRGSTSVDAKCRKGLSEIGFTVLTDGKHVKVVFQGDDRYTFALAKSGSDHRGGLNAASDIGGLLF